MSQFLESTIRLLAQAVSGYFRQCRSNYDLPHPPSGYRVSQQIVEDLVCTDGDSLQALVRLGKYVFLQKCVVTKNGLESAMWIHIHVLVLDSWSFSCQQAQSTRMLILCMALAANAETIQRALRGTRKLKLNSNLNRSP